MTKEMEAKLARLTLDLALLRKKQPSKDDTDTENSEDLSPESVVLSTKLGIYSISAFLEEAGKYTILGSLDKSNCAKPKLLKRYEEFLEKKIKIVRQAKEHWMSSKT
jgi:hypothetical protein